MKSLSEPSLPWWTWGGGGTQASLCSSASARQYLITPGTGHFSVLCFLVFFPLCCLFCAEFHFFAFHILKLHLKLQLHPAFYHMPKAHFLDVQINNDVSGSLLEQHLPQGDPHTRCSCRRSGWSWLVDLVHILDSSVLEANIRASTPSLCFVFSGRGLCYSYSASSLFWGSPSVFQMF